MDGKAEAAVGSAAKFTYSVQLHDLQRGGRRAKLHSDQHICLNTQRLCYKAVQEISGVVQQSYNTKRIMFPIAWL